MKISQSKVALVTGASKGIGFAIAERLLIIGMDVYICSRSQANLNKAQTRLLKILSSKNNVGKLIPFCCDVTNEVDIIKLVSAIKERYGYLSCLVNNCGGLSINNSGTFNELSNVQWQEVFNDNLMSMVTITKHAYPLLELANNGNVINISSVVAVQPGFYNPHYAAAKAALLAVSKNLSMLWAENGIRVNSISPGIIETDGWQSYISDKATTDERAFIDVQKEENSRAISNVPLKRLGLPVEVANCVEFLASDASAYMTGSNIIIDGGKHRAI